MSIIVLDHLRMAIIRRVEVSHRIERAAGGVTAEAVADRLLETSSTVVHLVRPVGNREKHVPCRPVRPLGPRRIPAVICQAQADGRQGYRQNQEGPMSICCWHPHLDLLPPTCWPHHVRPRGLDRKPIFRTLQAADAADRPASMKDGRQSDPLISTAAHVGLCLAGGPLAELWKSIPQSPVKFALGMLSRALPSYSRFWDGSGPSGRVA